MQIFWYYFLEWLRLFLYILRYAVIAEVLLSLLTLLWIRIVIGPLTNITQPLYKAVKKVFPTQFGMFDFTPIIILIVLDICVGWVMLLRNLIINSWF